MKSDTPRSFWLKDPSILLNKDALKQLLPSSSMSYTEKLNAITRLILILSVLGYIVASSVKILVAGLIALLFIVIIERQYTKKEAQKKVTKALKEGMTNQIFYDSVKSNLTAPKKENPLMNVMLPEIKYNPERKAAAPSFAPPVEKEINDEVKKNLDPKLFQDLGDNILFDQSMRQFHTMPNTLIPNDQKAFAEFCYGNMPSCKEGDPIQCEKKNFRYTLQ